VKLYVIGSLRNPEVPKIARICRLFVDEVFDDWYSAGPRADDHLQEYYQARGYSFAEALQAYATQNICRFDKRHLDASDAALLVMPAGKSAHTELGYVIGSGKPGYIYLPEEPERWDCMYALASGVLVGREQLLAKLDEWHSASA
jgi:hypothetical protein